MTATQATANRYLRQTVLPEIGASGQRKLAQARVLCVGAGGLGSPVALYLAAAGVGKITLIDPDRVDESNLQRQVLFSEADVRQPKATRAQARLEALNSSIEVQAIVDRLDCRNAREILSRHDVIVDGTDNFAAKFLINDAALALGLPVVYGSISRMEGQVSVFGAQGGPCYRCLYAEPPQTTVPNCAEAGILGAVAGVIGSLQSIEAIKLILGLPTLSGSLLIWDALSSQTRVFSLKKNPACPTCAKPRDQIELRDEAALTRCARAPLERAARAHALSPAELQRAMHKGKLRIIDVREAEEWRLGHIPEAIHFPLSRILKGEAPFLEAEIPAVFYCQSGVRSLRALDCLHKALDPRVEVSHLEGGLASWPEPLCVD